MLDAKIEIEIVALDDDREPEPHPDLERVMRQYVFRPIASLSDYEDAGRALVEGAVFHFIALGALLMRGYKDIRPHIDVKAFDPEAEGWTITTWEEYSAFLWGCTPKSLTKARMVAEAYAVANIPEDCPDSRVYEVQSGLQEGEDLETALEQVTAQNLSTWKIRIQKGLRNRGLVDGWTQPELRWRDDKLIVCQNGTEEVLARRVTNLSPLARAGLYMLSRGVAVREDKRR